MSAVPKTTLQDHVLGNLEYGKKPGPEPYLNVEEEKDLASFVEVVVDIGFGKTRKQIKAMVEKTARDKRLLRKDKISDGWFRQFLERQPQITLQKGDRTAAVRMDAMKNKIDLDNYFKELKRILWQVIICSNLIMLPVASSVRMGMNHSLLKRKFFTRHTLRDKTCMIPSIFLG